MSDQYFRSTRNEIAFPSMKVSRFIKVSDAVKINGSEIGSEPTVLIHGKSGQTNQLLNIENSAGTDYFTVNANGGAVFTGHVTFSSLTASSVTATTLSVSGGITISGATFTTLTSGGIITTTLTVNAGSTFTGHATFSTLTASGITTTTLTVSAGSTFTGHAIFSTLTAGGVTTTTLTVSAGSTFTGHATFSTLTGSGVTTTTLTVSAGSTFTGHATFSTLTAGGVTTTTLTVSGGFTFIGHATFSTLTGSGITTTTLTVNNGSTFTGHATFSTLTAGGVTTTTLTVSAGSTFTGHATFSTLTAGGVTTTTLTVSGGSTFTGHATFSTLTAGGVTTTTLTVSAGSTFTGHATFSTLTSSGITTTTLTVSGGSTFTGHATFSTLTSSGITTTTLTVSAGSTFTGHATFSTLTAGGVTTTTLTVSAGSTFTGHATFSTLTAGGVTTTTLTVSAGSTFTGHATFSTLTSSGITTTTLSVTGGTTLATLHVTNNATITNRIDIGQLAYNTLPTTLLETSAAITTADITNGCSTIFTFGSTASLSKSFPSAASLMDAWAVGGVRPAVGSHFIWTVKNRADPTSFANVICGIATGFVPASTLAHDQNVVAGTTGVFDLLVLNNGVGTETLEMSRSDGVANLLHLQGKSLFIDTNNATALLIRNSAASAGTTVMHVNTNSSPFGITMNAFCTVATMSVVNTATFASGLTSNNTIFLNSSGSGIEIGLLSGASSSAFIDFHTGGGTTYNDYHSQIIGVAGSGTTFLGSGQLRVNGMFSIAGATQSTFNGVNAANKFQVQSDNFTDDSAATTRSRINQTAFQQGTLLAQNGPMTYTDASTVFIGGEPLAGTNVNITNANALYVLGGVSKLSGGVSTTTLNVSGAATMSSISLGSTAFITGISTFSSTVNANTSVTVINGNNLALQAASGTPNDPGEIIFQKNDGTQKAKVYSGTGTNPEFLVETTSGTTVFTIDNNGTLSAGNTNITGLLTTASLSVTGISTLTGNVVVAGAITLSSLLHVAGAATLASLLHVAAAATLASTLFITSAATLASLHVSAATTLASLHVTGPVTFASTLFVSAAVTLASLNVSAATTLSSLHITGATTLASTLFVTGATTLASLHVTGPVTFASTLFVTGAATLASLHVTGAVTLASLHVTGVSTFAALTVTGSATFTAILRAGTVSLGSLHCIGAVTLASLLHVVGATTLSSLHATGAVTLASTLYVSGSVTLATDLFAPSNWKQLAKSTASAQATLAFTSIAGTTYNIHKVEIIILVPATSNTDLLLNLGTSGGFDSSATYNWSIRSYTTGGTTTTTFANNQTSIVLAKNVSTAGAATDTFFATIYFYNLGSATKFKSIRGTTLDQSSLVSLEGLGSGNYPNATAVDRIAFQMSSGNITSGTFILSGLADTV